MDNLKANETVELNDLEPIEEVKAGCGPFHKDDAPTDIIVGTGIGGHVKLSSTVGLGANGHVRVFDGKTL